MEDMIKKAKLRAMYLLTRRDKTEVELRRALAKGEYDKDAIEEAIAYVRSYGYLDDERYVTHYIENYKSSRSIARMKYDLSKRGISSELLHTLSLLEYEEVEAITNLIRKRWKSQEKPTEKELQKLYGYLARQGFKSRDIWAALCEENLT